MKEELQFLADHEDLDEEQWRYLEACFACAAGHFLFSLTS